MNKIKYIIAIILTGFIFSCEDFYDKQPLDQLSNATFWKTESDLNMALAGVYRRMQNEIIDDRIAAWDGLTDNAWSQYNWLSGFYGVAKGDVVSTNDLSSGMWSACYRAISSCNIFLSNIEGFTSVDQETKTRYTAEVRFIRAFEYYWLVQCFGGVPLVLEPLTFENMRKPRNTKDEVLAKIYEDLDFAIANLPDEPYSGHAVKASAQALKARIKLFNGNYADAVSISKQIMDGGLFRLSEDYRANFIESHDQDNCPEIIFSIKFLGPTNPNPSDQTYGWWGSVNPMEEFVLSHEPSDIRLKANVLSPGDPWPLGEKQNGPGSAYFAGDQQFVGTHYNCNKWVNQETATPADWASLGNDATHLRYAEVLLVYAEATNELTGPDQSVYDAVNAIRNRAELDDLPDGLSQEEMREKIRHERRIELAFEAQRYFDLKRWGIIGSIVPTIPEPPSSATTFRVWQDHFMLLPIPQAEIDKDPDNLVQNPGYE
jgi:hypothetical protein